MVYKLAFEGVPISKFKIENVVASTSLGIELDLPALAISLDGSEYEPEQFPGLIYRMKEPKTATLLFRSGKVVCTGAKSLDQVKMAIENVVKQIEKAGIRIKTEPKIEVQNIVASSDLGQKINLNAIAITLGTGAGGVRAGAVPWPRLSVGRSEGRALAVRLGQAGLHRRQEAPRRRGGGRQDHRGTAGGWPIALSKHTGHQVSLMANLTLPSFDFSPYFGIK